MRGAFVTASALALTMLAVGPVRAQEAPLSGADATAGEGDIIVTGEKAARTLQETPSSVAVTTTQRIANENLQTLQEVFNRTANIAETYGNTGFTIRGIANQGVSGAGDAPLSTIYIDGAALPDQLVGFGPTDLWDVGQVEIFRGPQSTLQGLNALAGAIVIRTQDPTPRWTGRARASIAEYDTTSFAAAVGGPIVPGELSLRLAAEKRDSDGAIRNITRDTPEAPVDALMLRGKLLWTPSALPGFEARVSYLHYDRKAGYDFSYANTDRPGYFDDRVATSNDPNSSDARADIGTLELTYALGGGLALSSVTSYSDTRLVRRFDSDLTEVSAGNGYNPYTADTVTQELRLNYDSSWLSGLLGGYYFHRDQFNQTTSLTQVPTPLETASALLQQAGLDADTANFVAGLYGEALPSIPVQYDGRTPIKVETLALFGDGRVKLTDRLTALVGFRWDHETNEVESVQTATFAGTYPDPAAYGSLAALIEALNGGVAQLVSQAGGSFPRSKRTFDAFLPKLGVEFAWTPDLATSFVAQRGYRSGGSSSNIARGGQVFPYDPEYTWNYELSLRSQWLDGRLTVNANAFYIDWTDQQVAARFSDNIFDYHTVNAGKSHIYGFELEGSYRPRRDVEFYASVGHTRTRFDDFETNVGTVNDLSGLEFIYAPHWTFAAGANVRFDPGITVNVNANRRTAVFTDVTLPQDQWRVGGRTLVNAKLGYAFDKFSVSVFANNLFDEEYKQYDNITNNRAILGDPQTFGVLLEAGF